MKLVLTALCAFIFVCGAYALTLADISGPLKVLKNPINLDYKTLPLLSVVFNHSTHMTYKCVLCHHKVTNDGKRYAPCTTEGCHSIPGARERVPHSMFMAYHAENKNRSCYGCHVKEAASHPDFIGCRPCHYRPLQEHAENSGK